MYTEKKLEDFVIKLDLAHYNFFNAINTKVPVNAPPAGFLIEDCFTPSGIFECYNVIHSGSETLVESF